MARLTKEVQDVLVAAARQGDNDAIQQLYVGLVPLLRNTVARMVGLDDADDVVQESMAKAFLQLDKFSGDASFSTWCVSIAKNTALMHLRKVRRKNEIVVDSIDRTLEGSSKTAIDVGYEDRTAEQNLASKTVHEAMSKLPRLQAQALGMQLDGYSTEEMALFLGQTIPAMKSILHRARHAMRDVITGKIAHSDVNRGECACGCGKEVHGRNRLYAKGHKKAQAEAVQSQAA